MSLECISGAFCVHRLNDTHKQASEQAKENNVIVFQNLR